MKKMTDRARRIFLAACGAIAAIALTLAGEAREHRGAARFDYYLMSLSWSPSYCLTHRDDADECGSRGFGFVLHGLWPQYRSGSWPQHCGSDRAPDRATVERALAFMPSRRLVEHEWQAHGSCSGLDPHAYFEQADRAFAALRIPRALSAPQSPPSLSARELVAAFGAANPGLDASMIRVVCRNGGQLSEVRVCLDRETLAPQACTGRVRDSCRYGKLNIPAAR
jgi:ribonuclease T2